MIVHCHTGQAVRRKSFIVGPWTKELWSPCWSSGLAKNQASTYCPQWQTMHIASLPSVMDTLDSWVSAATAWSMKLGRQLQGSWATLCKTFRGFSVGHYQIS